MLITHCSLALNSISAQGLLNFEKDTLHLGKIKQGEKSVDFTFTFTNTGDSPVIIEKIGVSCGCTEVSWSLGPIAPMEKGAIRGTYVPGTFLGDFRKRIVVFSNSTVSKLPLYIEGVIESEKTE